MSRHSSPAFSVQVDAYGPEALSVSGVPCKEGLSRLCDFRVDFFTQDGEPLVWDLRQHFRRLDAAPALASAAALPSGSRAPTPT